MQQRWIFKFTLLLLITLASCSAPAGDVLTITVQISPTTNPLPTSTSTLSPSPTYTQTPTQTPLPTPTATLTPTLALPLTGKTPWIEHLDLVPIAADNISRLKLIRTISLDKARVYQITFSPDNRFLTMQIGYSGSRGNTFILADVLSGTYQAMQGVYAVFSQQGDRLAIYNQGVGTTIHAFRQGQVAEVIRKLDGVGGPTDMSQVGGTMAFSSDGKQFAADSSSGFRIYDTEKWNEIRHLQGYFGIKYILPDWQSYMVVGGRIVSFRSFENDSFLSSLNQYQPKGVALSADNRFIGLTDYNGMVIVIERKTLREVQLLPFSGTFNQNGIAFSPDGNLVAAIGKENNQAVVKIWRISDGKLLLSQAVPNALSLSFSPDGKFLAVGVIKTFSPNPESNELWMFGVHQ